MLKLHINYKVRYTLVASDQGFAVSKILQEIVATRAGCCCYNVR